MRAVRARRNPGPEDPLARPAPTVLLVALAACEDAARLGRRHRHAPGGRPGARHRLAPPRGDRIHRVRGLGPGRPGHLLGGGGRGRRLGRHPHAGPQGRPGRADRHGRALRHRVRLPRGRGRRRRDLDLVAPERTDRPAAGRAPGAPAGDRGPRRVGAHGPLPPGLHQRPGGRLDPGPLLEVDPGPAGARGVGAPHPGQPLDPLGHPRPERHRRALDEFTFWSTGTARNPGSTAGGSTAPRSASTPPPAATTPSSSFPATSWCGARPPPSPRPSRSAPPTARSERSGGARTSTPRSASWTRASPTPSTGTRTPTRSSTRSTPRTRSWRSPTRTAPWCACSATSRAPWPSTRGLGLLLAARRQLDPPGHPAPVHPRGPGQPRGRREGVRGGRRRPGPPGGLVLRGGARTEARTNGEAARLPGGNTLHNYGSGSVIKEITPEGEVAWRSRSTPTASSDTPPSSGTCTPWSPEPSRPPGDAPMDPVRGAGYTRAAPP